MFDLKVQNLYTNLLFINDVIDIQWLKYFYPHYIFNIDTYVKLNVIAYLIKVKEQRRHMSYITLPTR